VTEILENVCPNCGGGFVARPVRPATARRPGVCLAEQPASTRRIHTNYRREELAEFSEALKNIKPELR